MLLTLGVLGAPIARADKTSGVTGLINVEGLATSGTDVTRGGESWAGATVEDVPIGGCSVRCVDLPNVARAFAQSGDKLEIDLDRLRG